MEKNEEIQMLQAELRDKETALQERDVQLHTKELQLQEVQEELRKKEVLLKEREEELESSRHSDNINRILLEQKTRELSLTDELLCQFQVRMCVHRKQMYAYTEMSTQTKIIMLNRVARPKFVEKTSMGGSQTTKFVKVFFLSLYTVLSRK